MTKANLATNTDSGSDQTKLFRELAAKTCELLSQENITLIPFRSVNVPYFSGLPQEYKTLVLFKLQATLNIYQSTLSNGHSLRDTQRLVWSALKEFGFTGPSDLMNLLENDDDIVEIYDNSQIQLFCNLRFYDFCSFTLEDLFCRPFQELFERANPQATQKILEVGLGMFQGQIKQSTNMTEAGTQVVRELDSPLGFEYEMSIHSFTPLFRKGSQLPEALVAVESARFLNAEEVESTKAQRLSDWESRQPTL